MRWELGTEITEHDRRWDRPKINIPFVQVDQVPLPDWEKENPQTIRGGSHIAFIDAETWRDFDKPAFFGIVILNRFGGIEQYPCGAEFTGKIDSSTGLREIRPTPHTWSWDRCEKHLKSHKKEQMEKCPDCNRVKPKSYGRISTRRTKDKDERKQQIIKSWCWADELETHLIPLMMEFDVRVIYAHNATVDLIAMLSQLHPDIHHPLELFIQDDPEEFSKILFRGSRILQAQLDLATYYNRHNSVPFSRKVWAKNKDGKWVESIKKDYPVKMIDSTGVLPLRLVDIGKAIGFPKGKTPEKFVDADHPDHGNIMAITDEDIAYCIQDCEVLFRGLNTFWKIAKSLGYRGDTMPLTSGTLGSQMTATANIYSDHKPKVYRLAKGSKWKYETITHNEDLDDVCRKAMVGGRTQCFQTQPIVDRLVYGTDANSMYPSVMINPENTYPDFRRQQGVENPEEITDHIIDQYEGVVFVNWKRPEKDRIGFLSTRNDHDLLDWNLPTGSRWITFPEYRFAKEMGYDLEIVCDPEEDLCAVIMPRLPFNMFECVQKWYDLRCEMKKNDDPSEFVLKILLNANFGKYVERNRDMIICTEETWVQMDPDWEFSSVTNDEGGAIGYATGGEWKRAKTTACVCGAYITAYARINLYTVAERVGYDHLVYCDTDSIYHTNSAIQCVDEGDGLGEWKLERVCDYWESASPKQYKYRQIWDEKNKDLIKWNARIKGCSLENAAQMMGIDYEKFCEDLDLYGSVTFERVCGIKESWRSTAEEMQAGHWITTTKEIGGK